jgi:HK97 gp10 family phage protein
VSYKIEGLDNILKKLENMADAETLEKSLGKCCALVEGEAKKKAPKDSGALRRSISSRVEGDKGIVFTPLEYAPYVEYGTGLFAENGGRQDVPWYYEDDEGVWHKTSGMKPQPYMRPALDENRKEILEILARGITDG